MLWNLEGDQVSHVACQRCPQLLGTAKHHQSSSSGHSNRFLRGFHLSIMLFSLSSRRILKMRHWQMTRFIRIWIKYICFKIWHNALSHVLLYINFHWCCSWISMFCCAHLVLNVYHWARDQWTWYLSTDYEMSRSKTESYNLKFMRASFCF